VRGALSDGTVSEPDTREGDVAPRDDGETSIATEIAAHDGDEADDGDGDEADDGDGDARDGGEDGPETAETVDADVVADTSGRACLVDGDCEGVPRPDLCAGPIRCIDYVCRPDPAGAVTCVDPVGTPCSDTACDPTTGRCEVIATCGCDTIGALMCGQTLQLSTNDPGAIRRYDAYGCGPGAGPWTQRALDFAPPPGRVRLDLVSTGTTALHVLASAESPGGAQCDPSAGCVAGAASRVYFDAPGTPLVVVIDQAAPNALVTLAATCGITSETQCADGLDDDRDGATDCADLDCNGVGGCPLVLTSEAGHCVGELDEDDDGATDCADPDCAPDPACLETCEVTTVNVGCGFHQGAPTGGGKARSTHYACSASPAGGKEIVYKFKPTFNGSVQVAFTGAPGLALYLLVDTGRGCTPRDCVATSTTGLVFQAVAGTTYYFAIDAPEGVSGNFDLHVTCGG